MVTDHLGLRGFQAVNIYVIFMVAPCISDIRSDLTRDLTFPTMSSVFEVESLPERCSSSTCSRPSKKDLCHLNTCALDRECSP